jgi:uncharacterized membrane protein YidH (DUF202 family)
VLGAVVAFMSLTRWEARERAMRLKRPLPNTRLPAVVAAGVGIVAVLAAILAIVNVIADG